MKNSALPLGSLRSFRRKFDPFTRTTLISGCGLLIKRGIQNEWPILVLFLVYLFSDFGKGFTRQHLITHGRVIDETGHDDG